MRILSWVVFLIIALFSGRFLSGVQAETKATQTSVPCVIGAGPTAAQCKQGNTYGVSLGSTSVEFLAADSTRNSLWIQNNGSNTACIGFETDGTPASQAAPQNCISVPTGQPMYFTNFNQGTTAGKGIISAITGISAGGTQIDFFFMEQ